MTRPDEPADLDRPTTPAPGAADSAGSRATGDSAGTAGTGGTGDSAGTRETAGTGETGGSGDGAGEPVDAAADAEFWATAARKREHAIRGTLAAALCLEALTVLFVPRAIARSGDGGLTGVRLTILVLLAAALLVTAGLVKRRAGIVLGSALQVAVIATGVLAGAMYFLGLLFAGVWAYVLWVRGEIIRAAARAGAPG